MCTVSIKYTHNKNKKELLLIEFYNSGNTIYCLISRAMK